MSLSSWLQRLFTPPSSGDPEPDEQIPSGFAWNQNARVMLAVVVVILSAFAVYWILS